MAGGSGSGTPRAGSPEGEPPLSDLPPAPSPRAVAVACWLLVTAIGVHVLDVVLLGVRRDSGAPPLNSPVLDAAWGLCMLAAAVAAVLLAVSASRYAVRRAEWMRVPGLLGPTRARLRWVVVVTAHVGAFVAAPVASAMLRAWAPEGPLHGRGLTGDIATAVADVLGVVFDVGAVAVMVLLVVRVIEIAHRNLGEGGLGVAGRSLPRT